jgi:hypothetical protein
MSSKLYLSSIKVSQTSLNEKGWKLQLQLIIFLAAHFYLHIYVNKGCKLKSKVFCRVHVITTNFVFDYRSAHAGRGWGLKITGGLCRKTIFPAKMKSPIPRQTAGERVSRLVCYLWPCGNNFMSGLSSILHE